MPIPATFRDLIEHVIDASGGTALDVNHTLAKRAVRAAFRHLVNAHHWTYYDQEKTIYLNAAYSTGTIEYTESTRAVALTTGTWPSWAANCRILIGNMVYDVATRTSDSEIILEPNTTPGANIASGTSYTLFQNTYELPEDFGGMYGFWSNAVISDGYLSPNDWKRNEPLSGGTSNPFFWTIMKPETPGTPGKYAIRTIGYPSTAQPISFFYRRQATTPKWSGFETAARAGTVAIDSSTKTVTGTSTTFESSMVGAVIRISSDGTNEPTNYDGLYPYTEENRIKTFTNATSIACYNTSSQTISGKKYYVSDLLDIDPQMINALQLGSLWQVHLLRGRFDEARQYREECISAVRDAMESEIKDFSLRTASMEGKRLGRFTTAIIDYDE